MFVPFPLGRPLGEPGDAAFQTRVLRRALALFDRRDGPVILEDFADDAPSQSPRTDWSPPFRLPAPAAPTPEAMAAELGQVIPWWHKAIARFGRTTVGISGQPPEVWPGFAGALLSDRWPLGPVEGLTPALSLRFLCDDLKALYGEAAQAEGPLPGIGQVDSWFWSRTVAGRFLIALRTAGMKSEDNALRTVASRFLVPTSYLPGHSNKSWF
jgi:hypothetical protein